ncbi:hypothetical protein IB270_33215 [Ensifer sp. ENS05]|nr:hypothetical protein [Ensifer sp. ENS05]
MAVLGSRFSADIDYHHRSIEDMKSHMEADLKLLKDSGYALQKKSDIGHGVEYLATFENGAPVVVDWTFESDNYYYEPIEDPQLGYRVHSLDAAAWKVGKTLKRRAPRDYFDLLEIDKTHVPLHVGVYMFATQESLSPVDVLVDLKSSFQFSRDEVASISAVASINPEKFNAEASHMLERAHSFSGR